MTIVAYLAVLSTLLVGLPRAQSSDACDKYGWQSCSTVADCTTKHKNNAGTHGDGTQNKDERSGYDEHTCGVPVIPGCTEKRCLPVPSSAFPCKEEEDCFQGDTCDTDTNRCVACDATPGFAAGACQYVADFDPYFCNEGDTNKGTPSEASVGLKTCQMEWKHKFPRREYDIKRGSGCQGDHCDHECGYDTSCQIIEADQTNVDLGPLAFDATLRDKLLRPRKCGGSDTGGGRCAADIERMIREATEKTPDTLRDPKKSYVQMSIRFPLWKEWNGSGGSQYEASDNTLSETKDHMLVDAGMIENNGLEYPSQKLAMQQLMKAPSRNEGRSWASKGQKGGASFAIPIPADFKDKSRNARQAEDGCEWIQHDGKATSGKFAYTPNDEFHFKSFFEAARACKNLGSGSVCKAITCEWKCEGDECTRGDPTEDFCALRTSDELVEDLYAKKAGVGGWGGTCTCPSGKVFYVGDNNDNCGSLACNGGVAGECGSSLPQSGQGMAAECGAYTKEPKVVGDAEDATTFVPNAGCAHLTIVATRAIVARDNNNPLVWTADKKEAVYAECQMKHVTDAPLHMPWGKTALKKSEKAASRATMLVRACTSKLSGSGSVGDGATVTRRFWEDPSTKERTYFNEEQECSDWGMSGHIKGFDVMDCSVMGPDTTSVVPTPAQRDELEASIAKQLDDGDLRHAETVRIAFHDAASFTDEDSQAAGSMQGGAGGCLRFTEMSGTGANFGLPMTISNLEKNCFKNNHKYSNRDFPFSAADMFQFLGAVGVKKADGPDFVNHFRWGRADHPRLFCQLELLKNLPDVSGGQKTGFMVHGASNIEERLAETLEHQQSYFEDILGLETAEWVALLGAHSLGGVRGIDHAKTRTFHFDDTPTKFDNKYYQDIKLAGDSSLMSLCPHSKPPAEAHWFRPNAAGDDNLVLLDTDASMAMDEDVFAAVKSYAHSQNSFFKAFVTAYLKVSENSYAEGTLIAVGEVPDTYTWPPADAESYEGYTYDSYYGYNDVETTRSPGRQRTTTKAPTNKQLNFTEVEALPLCPCSPLPCYCTQVFEDYEEETPRFNNTNVTGASDDVSIGDTSGCAPAHGMRGTRMLLVGAAAAAAAYFANIC